MPIEEKIEYLAKAVMTLSELGDGKTAYVLNEIRLEMKSQLGFSKELEEAAMEYAEKHGFRVPYDGSNNFYDDVDVKASKEGFIAGAKWGTEHK